jgi:hypothetical protein
MPCAGRFPHDFIAFDLVRADRKPRFPTAALTFS